MKKRFLSAFFAIVLCVAAYPINTLAGQSIDDQLISRGYPLKLIESMPEEEKEDFNEFAEQTVKRFFKKRFSKRPHISIINTYNGAV